MGSHSPSWLTVCPYAFQLVLALFHLYIHPFFLTACPIDPSLEPDTEAIVGHKRVSQLPHSVRSNLIIKVLILYHCWRFSFSDETPTDTFHDLQWQHLSLQPLQLFQHSHTSMTPILNPFCLEFTSHFCFFNFVFP